jgi:hypothetical protein
MILKKLGLGFRLGWGLGRGCCSKFINAYFQVGVRDLRLF